MPEMLLSGYSVAIFHCACAKPGAGIPRQATVHLNCSRADSDVGSSSRRLRDQANFRVRNCHICHLKTLDRLGLLVVLFMRRHQSLFCDDCASKKLDQEELG
jgi:hypothetical protein